MNRDERQFLRNQLNELIPLIEEFTIDCELDTLIVGGMLFMLTSVTLKAIDLTEEESNSLIEKYDDMQPYLCLEADKKEKIKRIKSFIYEYADIVRRHSEFTENNWVVNKRSGFKKIVISYRDFIIKFINTNIVPKITDIADEAEEVLFQQIIKKANNEHLEYIKNDIIPTLKNMKSTIKATHSDVMKIIATTKSEIEEDSDDYRFFMEGIHFRIAEQILELIKAFESNEITIEKAIKPLHELDCLIITHIQGNKQTVVHKF